eukprot:1315903-Pleurochrysis_carterae.AAC.2
MFIIHVGVILIAMRRIQSTKPVESKEEPVQMHVRTRAHAHADSRACARSRRRAQQGPCDQCCARAVPVQVVAWLPPKLSDSTASDADDAGADGERENGDERDGGAGGGGLKGEDDATEEEPALWRLLHDDGDVEEVEADELEEALAAHAEARTVQQAPPPLPAFCDLFNTYSIGGVAA